MSKDRKLLIKKLDLLSKNVVRQRDGNICQHCYKYVEGSFRHVSHVIPVSAGNKLRWEPLNMKVLCYHCHINWWHKNPVEAGQWFKDIFPERWEYISEHRGTYKFSIQELEELVNNLKNQLN